MTVWVLEYCRMLDGQDTWQRSGMDGEWSFREFLRAIRMPPEKWAARDVRWYRIRNTMTGETITAQQILELVAP